MASTSTPRDASRADGPRWGALVGFITVCLGAGILGSVATRGGLVPWYATLTKPSWTPPPWLFGPVWTLLYIGMAVAAWRVWQGRDGAGPMRLFAMQLALNTLWSFLFFGMQRPDLAFVDIVALWLSIAATLASFWRRDRVAGALFVPYLAWVSFASALNLAIWRLNA